MDLSDKGIKLNITPREALSYILHNCPVVTEFVRHKSQTDFHITPHLALKLAAYFTTLYDSDDIKPIEIMQLNWMGRIIGPNNYEFWLYLQLAKDLIECQNNSFINGVPFAIIGSPNYQNAAAKYKAPLPTYSVEYDVRAMTFLNSHNVNNYPSEIYTLMHHFFMMDDYGDIFRVHPVMMFYLNNESH